MDSLEADGNVISQNQGGGIFNEGSGVFIEENWIEKNAGVGIYCNRHSTISGNVISGNSGTGIQLGGSSLVTDNIVKNNGDVGISLHRYATAIIGGSQGNGNDIYGHRWHELYGRGGAEIINAQYNYFGVPVPTSREVFPFENFDISNYTETSIVTKGDVNRDNVINVLDIVLTINFIIYNLRPTPLHFMAADLNEDERIDVLDVVKIVNAILYPR